MGRTVLLLMVLATTLLMTSGVAWAAVSEVGGPGGDAIVGTEGDDALAGGGGSDRVSGVGGDDFMDGGPPATPRPRLPPARRRPTPTSCWAARVKTT
jgi:RTX calcium-binding nonapeptide repeat (4 copies)